MTTHESLDAALNTRKESIFVHGQDLPHDEISKFVEKYVSLHPKARVGILAASFRQAKSLFESIVNSFLKEEDLSKIQRTTESYTAETGETKISAVPIRPTTCGPRFGLIIVDQYDSIPDKNKREIISPMLCVTANRETREIIKL